MSDQGQLRGLLELVLGEFRERGIPDLVRRSVEVPVIPGKATALIGMRRSGKTYLQFQRIRELLDDGVEPERILYLNFEDERILPLDAAKLGGLLDSFFTMFPSNHDRRTFLFLDEIQNVDGWPVVLRRFLDTRDVEIHATGSSARLLSTEIATSLRGRAVSCDVFPYSYREFLVAKEYGQPQAVMGAKARDTARQYLLEYLRRGGFPEVVSLDERLRTRVLQDYVDIVVFRDIVERHGVSNLTALRYLVRTLLASAGRSLSVSKFHNDLKSQGIPVSKNTLHEYLAHVEDAYLAFPVPIFTESVRKRNTNPRKIYAVDPGLVTAYAVAAGRDIGQLFENLVYLALRRAGCRVAYYRTRSGFEVDFVARYPDGRLVLYQVAADVSSPKTLEREMRALDEGREELDADGELVTLESYAAQPF